MNNTEFLVKDCYICNFCKNICGGGCYDIKQSILNGEIKEGTEFYEENKDLDCDRKQIIGCLGKYCDKPCELNKSDAYKDIPVDVFIRTIKYLGNKCNELIENESTNTEED